MPTVALDTLDALVDRFDSEVFDAPSGRARIRLAVTGAGSFDVEIKKGRAKLQRDSSRGAPDALLEADAPTWRRIGSDLTGGMAAYRAGRLTVRHNLHLGVGFLAATSGSTDAGRLKFRTIRTKEGRMSILEAGEGPPLLMLHGLGGTKASFLPTVAALAPHFRTIAVDLPGYGDSDKPFPAPYDAAFFARWTLALMDELELDRVNLLGHSMGARAALEIGFEHPERIESLALMTPSMAWRGNKRWATWLRLIRPELGIIQPTPRPVVESFVRRIVPGADSRWVAAGVDEFLRAYLSPRGRVAFYASARNIYLENGDGPEGFWTRLESLAPRALFLWGRHDQLAPIGFQRHVRQALPNARHVELPSGHVPQLESPGQAHAALSRFFRGASGTHEQRSRPRARAASLRRS